MVGLYPDTRTIGEITESTHVRDILNHGYHWLRVSMSEHRNPLDIPLDQLCAIYHSCRTITTPEFINLDLADGKGYWRIPFVATEGPGLIAALGLLMSAFDIKLFGRDWSLIGEGVGAGRGDLFVRALLFREEFDAICQRVNPEFPASLWVLGVPAPIMRLPSRPEAHLGHTPRMHIASSIRADPQAMRSSLIDRPPLGLPGHRYIDLPINRGHMGGGIDRGMNRGLDRMARIPETHLRPARHQPMAFTGNIIASSSSDDTATESDSSRPESDSLKRGTKKKTTKAKSKGRSEGNSRQKSLRREKSSSPSDSQDEPPKKPRKAVKNDEPRGKAARRGRSPSDEEIAYSADEQRKKGKVKTPTQKSNPEAADRVASRHKAVEAPERPRRQTRGRSPSDDEGQAPSGRKSGRSEARPRAGDQVQKVTENKAQGASSGKVGKASGGHLGGKKNRERRSPSEDEGPPRLDPTEQARLDALKAQNGYDDGKPEKSGWH
ncbi:MAG: hypothetical protein Q9221_007279 [Calogaya cf. arnoldii]